MYQSRLYWLEVTESNLKVAEKEVGTHTWERKAFKLNHLKFLPISYFSVLAFPNT